MLGVVIGLIVVALIFDFLNGFHDAANAIATVVSTRVLSPALAVAWAAFFNFVAAFSGELHVANTMGKGIIQFDQLKAHGATVVLTVIFAALVGAIVWDIVTWWWGLPSSSSHALAGGLIGGALPALGVHGLVADGILKIIAFIVISPIVGLVLGTLMMILSTWAVHRQTPARVDRWIRRLQLLSSGVFSYSHGTNDAQKTMGIIVSLLVATQGAFAGETGWLRHLYLATPDHVPIWVELGAYAAISLGTLFGGWRIVRTMGHSLTKLQPIGGFSAEMGGGVTILGIAALGIPVSTTHTITGAIVGVGSTRGARAVHWGVAGRIIWAWIFTMPAAAAVSVVAYFITHGVVLALH